MLDITTHYNFIFFFCQAKINNYLENTKKAYFISILLYRSTLWWGLGI